MPIAREEFEEYDPDDRRTNAERVIDFLAENDERAFRVVEIAEATGVADGSIHPVLGRLREEGVVRHRSPYWAIDEDEDGRERWRREGGRGRGRRDSGRER